MLTQTFKPSDTLIDVNKYILMNRSGDNLVPFVLMTNFPKKTFSPDDMGRTLQELGEHVYRTWSRDGVLNCRTGVGE